MLNTFIGAPGMIRTYDTRIRNPVLYPLSYGGNVKRYNLYNCGIYSRIRSK